MPSSAGSNSPPRRPALVLAAVALAALGLSLGLAYASTLQRPARASGPVALQASPAARFGSAARPPTTGPAGVAPAAQPAAASTGADEPRRAMLWTLVIPWALAVDALALVGIAVVLALRRAGPGPRRARR